jgi:similar to stage IV sporulation protein
MVRRFPLLIVALLLALVLHLMGYFVWFVEVKGREKVPERKLEEVLADLGIRPGVPVWRLDLERASQEIPLRLPEVVWAGLYRRGTKVVVELAERKELPAHLRVAREPADIVAAKDALLEQLLVFQGQPLVPPGSFVRQGQVIVRGTPHARAVVRGRVWYGTYVEVPTREEILYPTGREALVRRLLAGQKVILSFGSHPPFRRYRLEVRSLAPAWSPLRWEILLYREVVGLQFSLKPAEALERGTLRARSLLLRRMPPGARVIREERRVLQLTPRLIGLRLLVEAEEEVGLRVGKREVKEGASGGQHPGPGALRGGGRESPAGGGRARGAGLLPGRGDLHLRR